jgi:hypothetical protein
MFSTFYGKNAVELDASLMMLRAPFVVDVGAMLLVYTLGAACEGRQSDSLGDFSHAFTIGGCRARGIL